MSDLDALPWTHDDGRLPNGAKGRRPASNPTPEASRRGRNNRKRGTSDELVVARILGGRKVGQLNLPWDVEVEGYARIQAKQLDRWPSLAKVIEWLDAIPTGRELRGVALADTPGPGHRIRRLLVVDLEEYATWHGK